MCGILFCAYLNAGQHPLDSSLWQRLKQANSSRGPDAQNEVQFPIHKHVEPLASWMIDFYFVASELKLRGDRFVQQPHSRDGNLLCWNGEIFDGMEISIDENDGTKLMNVLSELEDPDLIPELLGTIEGPYALVFYHGASNRLYFARDPLGRRSLLIHTPTSLAPFFLLTSVSVGPDPGYDLEELDTGYIYCLDTQHLTHKRIETSFGVALKRLPRSPEGSTRILPFTTIPSINRALPPSDYLQQPLDRVSKIMAESVDGLIYHLDRSVELRVNNIPVLDKAVEARVAVLFSGGIDSAAIAYFAHKHVPPLEPIDLLNVAFENPRKLRARLEGSSDGVNERGPRAQVLGRDDTGKLAEGSYLVPDRVTGLQEWNELQRVCPGRQWNFVEINVPYSESQAARSVVESIMFPSRTVMDLSLALALYFASGAVGQIRIAPSSELRPYVSPARVLLNGLGADELLGGYGRHRTIYESGGWKGVIDELQLDLDRIPARNLGRDDRVISSHGKEMRHPFLSLSVIQFLAALPVHYKLDPRLELGLGDKMLLRLAMKKVGLVEASGRKKRAMQFGSYSARMNGERRGDASLDSMHE